jgi:hypothetical protein
LSSQSAKNSKSKNSIEFPPGGGYFSPMRRSFHWLIALCWLAGSLSCPAATGRVIKVLPHFLDLEGRVALSPSLFERDSYQAILRLNPDRRSGIRYAIQWKTKGAVWEPLTVRIELRGVAQGKLPKQLILETSVERSPWYGRWTYLTLKGSQYTDFGEVTAWRATLWEGTRLLSEQKSFLW